MWLQQDGVPPYFHRDVRRYLDTPYANKCTVRGSINLWPPRSPDITPLDYFLLGMVKSVSIKHLSTVEKISNIE
jgi:hypothetical protein